MAFALKTDQTVWTWGSNLIGRLGNDAQTCFLSWQFPLQSIPGNHSFTTLATCRDSWNTILALKADGSAWAWGANSYGELGNQAGGTVSSPVAVVGDHSFTKLSGAGYCWFGLKSNGSAWGWGFNTSGQLGLNDVTNRSSPVVVLGHHSFIDIVSSSTSTYGLKANGSIWSWGSNACGELGDNSRTSYSSPIAVVGAHSFVKLSTGLYSAYGLKADGSIWAWGLNTYGQLGNNTRTSYSSPIAIVGSHSFTDVFGGYLLACGLKADGSLWMWGYNAYGELGQQNLTSYSSPVAVVGNHSFTSLTTSRYAIMALKADGSAWGWGVNVGYKLAPGIREATSRLSYSSPIAVVGGLSFTSLILNEFGGVGLVDGAVYAWGVNSSGRCGGLNQYQNKNSPINVVGNHSFRDIYGSANHILARKANGEVWGWGSNATGQCGTNIGYTAYDSPVQIIGNHTFTQIATAANSSAGLKSDGSVWIWGSVYEMSLGERIFTALSYSSPIQLVGNHSFVELSCGSTACYARKADGSVWGWGLNSAGHIGNNLVDTSNSRPMIVVGNHSFSKVIGSNTSAHALKEDGSAWSWGYNLAGNLGNNNRTSYSSPVAVVGSHVFTKIISRSLAVFGIKSTGAVWAWGLNTYGQLGNNTRTSYSSPIAIVGGHLFTKMAASPMSSFGLKADGSVWAWGQNTYGELGTGNRTSYSSPITVVGSHSFIDIAAGYVSGTTINSTYGLKADGSIWAWGANTYGQLGNGDRTSYSSPVLVIGNHVFVELTAFCTVLARKADGSIWSWGNNTFGELGTGNRTSYSSPVAVVGSHSFTQISTGLQSSHALKEDGSIWSWGNNTDFILGATLPDDTKSPVELIGNHSFIQIAGSQVIVSSDLITATTPLGFYLGLKSDGSVWGWGDNTYGQLGNSTRTTPFSPVAVVGSHSFIKLGNNGSYASYALKADGSMWAWGRSDYGQIGNSLRTSYSSPVAVVGNHSFVEFAAGVNYVLARKANGEVWGWGNNSAGMLGVNNVASYSSPVQVVGNHSFVEIMVDGYMSFARKANGEVWGWGWNTYNGLGHGELCNFSTSQSSPIAVVVGNFTFATIYPGTYHIFGVKADNSIWAWGSNGSGQLGNNSTTQVSSPVAVVGNHTFTTIIGGYGATHALKPDNGMWGWGNNTYGELGDNTITNYSSPVTVVGNPFFTSGVGIAYTTYGLKSNGMIYAWGRADYGQIGNNSTTSYSSPVFLAGGHAFASLAKSDMLGYHIGALKDDGSAWMWGLNTSGQCGNASTTNLSSPTGVVGSHSFIDLCVTTDSTYGLKADGSVWAWGLNTYGQLGNGTTTSYSSPIAVIGSHSFVSIVALDRAALGVKEDGSLWTWGGAGSGQLGRNDYNTYSSPVQVVGNHSFASIVSGGQSVYGLKDDGIIWAWGVNLNGQLSNYTGNKSSPVLVVGSHVFNTIGNNHVGVTSGISFSTPIIWGEENPASGEIPFKWDIWSDGGRLQPTFTSSWGKLQLDGEGVFALSDVIWLPNNNLRYINIKTDTYEAGAGSYHVYIRGSATEFAQDDTSPEWEEWTTIVGKEWNYIQLKVMAD